MIANVLSGRYFGVVDIAANLAHNIKQLREARGLTQTQLAKVAGIPRPTWANLETGVSNPTLAVLSKVAAALQVSIEELISPPRAVYRHYPADQIPRRLRGNVAIRKLLPDAIPGLEIDRMELRPQAALRGIPHTPGTREYLTCESGALELTVSGEKLRLAPGDVVAFRGDQSHSYFNPLNTVSIAYSVVALAPATAP
jgi:XRE family transcriptional regulator, regulator of sulfur utilization